MSFVTNTTAISLLLVLFYIGELTADVPDVESGRSLFRAFNNNRLTSLGDDETAYVNGRFLDTLLAQPSKRQWCRKGMTYNHVLGSCTLSLSALRERSKWQ